MGTWYLQVRDFSGCEGEEDIPVEFMGRQFRKKGVFFENHFGRLTFEFVERDLFIYVTDPGVLRPKYQNGLQLLPDLLVWNAFYQRKKEAVWRVFLVAHRTDRKDVPIPRKKKWVIGSFLYGHYLWLAANGDLLEVTIEGVTKKIPIYKGY